MDANKYQSTIKVEFRDLVSNLVKSKRKSFHLYTIHRLLSLGLLIDFTFQYIKIKEPQECIGIELCLDNFGKVLFIVDVDSNYVRISGDGKTILENFLNHFDTCISEKSIFE